MEKKLAHFLDYNKSIVTIFITTINNKLSMIDKKVMYESL